MNRKLFMKKMLIEQKLGFHLPLRMLTDFDESKLRMLNDFYFM